MIGDFAELDLGAMVRVVLHQHGFPRLSKEVLGARPIFDEDGVFAGVAVMLPDEFPFDATADAACRRAADQIYKMLKLAMGEPAGDLISGGGITAPHSEVF